MPTERIIQIFQFDELSDAAKEKARAWYRDGSAVDTFWAETVIDDAQRMAALMGITFGTHPVKLMGGNTRQEPSVSWSLGYTQNDFACFEGDYAFAPHAARAIRKETGGTETVLIGLAERLAALQAGMHRNLTAKVTYHAYFGMRVVPYAENKFGAEINVPDAVEAELKEIFRDFNSWIYKSLRAECDHQNADEQVDESITANEYEFLEDGSRA